MVELLSGLRRRIEGLLRRDVQRQGEVRKISRYSTKYIADRAALYLDWFEKRDSRPWFLYVSTFAPHGPATPARAYAKKKVPSWKPNPAVLEEDKSDKPPYLQNSETSLRQIHRKRRSQLRSLMSVDDLVGKLLHKLKRQDELHNTLALFTSDNGIHWGEHGRNGKLTPYTYSLRIPLFIRWPGRTARAVDDRIVTNLDLAPSVLEAIGATPDPAYPMDGRSLIDQTWQRDRLLTEFWQIPKFNVPTWSSLRTPHYQYVEYYEEDETTVTFREYYDLTADPWQLENLLYEGAPPGVDLEALSQQLAEDRACSGSSCP
ncbi:MAG: sulfatase-like hydrolase/transferase [Actinomycetota bacterium]